MRYELVLFDADATLYDFEKSELYGLKSAFLNIDISLDNKMLSEYHKINKFLWNQFEENKINIKNLNYERFRLLFEKFNIPNDYIEFSEIYLDCLGEFRFLLDGAQAILEYLSGKCKIVLITNGIAKVQHKRFDNSKIRKYFDHLIISEEINSSKPNRKIFEYTLDKCKYSDKSKTIIIGDSLNSDILGGQNFGIDTCWYNPNEKENNETKIKPTYIIKSLNEIKKIVVD